MQTYVDRLMKCGVDPIDAYEICEEYFYDGDYFGLAEYVRMVEFAYYGELRYVD